MSVRVGSVSTLDDPNSPQSKASEWILEECAANPPIDPCDEQQILLNEQRYALAVMYYSLGGDNWNYGANPGLVIEEEGVWMSPLNYCEWGVDVEGGNNDGLSYNMLECDDFGNVLNLNLRECYVVYGRFFLMFTYCIAERCLTAHTTHHSNTIRIKQHARPHPTRTRNPPIPNLLHLILQRPNRTHPHIPRPHHPPPNIRCRIQQHER